MFVPSAAICSELRDRVGFWILTLRDFVPGYVFSAEVSALHLFQMFVKSVLVSMQVITPLALFVKGFAPEIDRRETLSTSVWLLRLFIPFEFAAPPLHQSTSSNYRRRLFHSIFQLQFSTLWVCFQCLG